MFIRLRQSVSLITMQLASRHTLALSFGFLLTTLFAPGLHAQTAATDPKTVPLIDGGIGPCSADFIVIDSTQAPVYNAKIKVHIAYRFMNFHKLDLEVGTNADGKARFIGLPDKTKQGLFFLASQGDREGSAFDDPAKTCKAAFTIQIEKKPQ
jgi:hypothetical protein